MRGRSINSRFMLFQDRLQSQELDDYDEEKEWKRLQRQYEGRESATDTQARQESSNLAQKERGEDLETDSKIPKFIRLYDVDTRPSSSKVTVQLIRHQLRSCTSPEDFTRVFTVLLDRRPGMPNAEGKGARLLANESTQRIIAHSLARYDPGRALVSLSLLIRRLEEDKQEIDNSILKLALLTSAQTHSFVALRRYLRMSVGRQYEEGVSGTLLYRISEEILNGIKSGFEHNTAHPKASEALQALLYAPSLNVFHRKEYLRSYLPREFNAFANWVNILTECRAVDRINQEWTWTQERILSKKSWAGNEFERVQFLEKSPRLFMHAFFRVGSPKDAWAIFEKYGSQIAVDDDEIWDQLVENVEHKPDLPEPLQQIVENMLTERLDKMLQDIEKNMGIAWVPGKDGEKGHHDVSNSEDQAQTEIEEEQERPEDPLKDVKAFTQFAVEREEEILAQKDDILAGRDPRPYKAPFS